MCREVDSASNFMQRHYDRKEFGDGLHYGYMYEVHFFYVAPNGYITKEELRTFLCNFTNYWLPGLVV